MEAEIITIGDEILIGQTIDTNSAWMSQRLYEIGIAVRKITSIQDEETEIIKALNESSKNAKLILITGGLGPTKDDITKHVLCQYFDTKLVLNQEVLSRIEDFFLKRGRTMLESNVKQAELPENCKILPNLNGTASGMLFEKDGVIFVSMPGVPYEMKALMQEHVIPYVKEKFKLDSILHKTIMTEGIGESFLVEQIKDWENNLESKKIKIAYLPSPGIVKIRLSVKGPNHNELEQKIDKEVAALKKLIPSYFFAEEDTTLEQVIGDKLRVQKKTVATAESCTGGYLAHLLTKNPGSSDYFVGSILSYANEIKVDALDVDQDDLMKHGAVSEPVVRQMAEGLREKFKVDYALATSGIAGPSGGSEEKPVGTVWIALASKEGTYAKKFLFEQNRERNIRRASLSALSMLRRKIDGLLKN